MCALIIYEASSKHQQILTFLKELLKHPIKASLLHPGNILDSSWKPLCMIIEASLKLEASLKHP